MEFSLIYELDLGTCGRKDATVIGNAFSSIDNRVEVEVTEIFVEFMFRDMKQTVNLYSEISQAEMESIKTRAIGEYIVRRTKDMEMLREKFGV